MGSFSIWHWVIVLVFILVPLIFVFRSPPPGPNRFGAPPSPMGFGEAISSFFKNYVNFNGRAARSEYWFAMLFLAIMSFIFGLIDRTDTLGSIWAIAMFLPGIAVAARRLHDINRSGWHQLLWILAPVGTIVVFCWYCTGARDGGSTTDQNLSKAPATLDSVEVLERLAKLRASGAISAEEYEAEKKKIFRI